MKTDSFTLSVHRLAQAISLALLTFATTQAQAVNYTFSDLGSINGAYAGYGANGINNNGQVAGYVKTGPGNNDLSAATWTGNSLTLLGSLSGQVMSLAEGINDTGQITPTALPVPGAAWLFGSVLAGFFGIKRG